MQDRDIVQRKTNRSVIRGLSNVSSANDLEDHLRLFETFLTLMPWETARINYNTPCCKKGRHQSHDGV